jgi:hypothetical protein
MRDPRSTARSLQARPGRAELARHADQREVADAFELGEHPGYEASNHAIHPRADSRWRSRTLHASCARLPQFVEAVA